MIPGILRRHIQHVVRNKKAKDGGKKVASSSSSASAGAASFSIGDRVWVVGVGAGKVAFVGDHHVKKTPRCAVSVAFEAVAQA